VAYSQDPALPALFSPVFILDCCSFLFFFHATSLDDVYKIAMVLLPYTSNVVVKKCIEVSPSILARLVNILAILPLWKTSAQKH
jgi:hypothetical protein